MFFLIGSICILGLVCASPVTCQADETQVDNRLVEAGSDHKNGQLVRRPNILIAISDDQSWPHASAYGSKMVDTPNFDRIAKEGTLFTQAFCSSPGCSPSRAALLTGLNTWQIEHAGTHGSYFSPKFTTFPDRLAEHGYFVGSAGKGWGPGDFKHLGRTHNPAGQSYAAKGKGSRYIEGFREFLRQKPNDQPFCFWFGSNDPHRSYEKGSGLKKGKQLADAEVPPFLPDTPEIRSDLLDYAFEVERFDDDLGEILKLLVSAGEFEKTLIIVTSDNGMPMPRAKANCYEYGIHMPLAIRMPTANAKRRVDDVNRADRMRTVSELVGFTDLTATIYDVANVEPPVAHQLVGKSIRNLLTTEETKSSEFNRDAVFGARERHSSSRFNSLGYPQRYVRTQTFLYIRNFTPERWPAGPSQKYSKVTYAADGSAQAEFAPQHLAYHDIDACPTLSFFVQHREDEQIGRFLELAVGLRPAEELYDVRSDPGCLSNLAKQDQWQDTRKELAYRLQQYLASTNDPRVTGTGDVWETYPRVSSLRWFPRPDWAVAEPDKVPEQDWLERRRPTADRANDNE